MKNKLIIYRMTVKYAAQFTATTRVFITSCKQDNFAAAMDRFQKHLNTRKMQRQYPFSTVISAERLGELEV